MDIRFDVSTCEETGGFVARWDDPAGGGICTQGESIADLETMLRDAVEGYFAEGGKPLRIQLHFEDLDPNPHHVTDEEAMQRLKDLKSGRVKGLSEEEFWKACGRS